MHHRAQLPPSWTMEACLLAGIIGVAVALTVDDNALARARWRGGARIVLLLLAVFVGSAGWAGHVAHMALDERVAPALEGRDIDADTIVEQMPIASEYGIRVVARVVGCEAGPQRDGCRIGMRVRLAWRDPPRLVEAGQSWRMQVRLKRPQSPQNPGLFDAEQRALEDGIAASGTVRRARPYPQDDASQGASAAVWRDPLAALHVAIERWRGRIRNAVLAATAGADPAAQAILRALVVGDQAAIAPEAWDRFNRTGIGHLMSISGLHVTMLAALAGWLCSCLWRSARFGAVVKRLTGRLPAAWITRPVAAGAFGIVVAFAYSALSGWGIPAQRTCWMLLAAALVAWSGRVRSARTIIAAAVGVVIVADPWAPLSAGFWLSFGAVTALIWSGQRRYPLRASWHALADGLRTQFAATLLALPLGALFFATTSWVGPLANAFAIPLVSWLIAPLALIGAAIALLSTTLAGWLLTPAIRLTEGLLTALGWLDWDRSVSTTLGTPDAMAFALAIIACGLALAPWPGRRRRWLLLALLPLLAKPVARPQADEIWLSAIDVGQGMAILVELDGYRLLYDTGPRYSEQADAAQRIVLPWLRSRGIDRLDAMVVSHADVDHAGGALTLMSRLPIDRVMTSLPAEHPIVLKAADTHAPCVRGEHWRHGQTEFRWLHPDPEPPADSTARRASHNSRSCVLRIAGPAGTILLPGDLEAPQERALLAAGAPLQADVLAAPHHGSTTSSTAAFVAAVRPRWVIFQVGYRNRFGHPKPVVVERYRRVCSTLLRSDADGWVQLRLAPGAAPQVERYRTEAARYWHVALPLDETRVEDCMESSSPAPSSSAAAATLP